MVLHAAAAAGYGSVKASPIRGRLRATSSGSRSGVDFTETLAVLLDLVGEEVAVTVANQDSAFVSASFSGVLGKGDELLRGRFGEAEAVSFALDSGGTPARFTITSTDFSESHVDDNRLTIIEAGIEFTFDASSHPGTLKEPRGFDESLPHPSPPPGSGEQPS